MTLPSFKRNSSCCSRLEIPAADVIFSLLMEIQPRCSEKMWLGGGALRDVLVGSNISAESDMDLLFFNENELSKDYEADMEAELTELTRIQNLSVKNQARMGLIAEGVKYENLLECVAGFPDVTVATAACIYDVTEQTTLVYAPYGLPSKDHALIQPTSRYLAAHGKAAYYSWLDRKKYDRRFRDWTISTVAREPFAPSNAFYECVSPS
jgi:hypothetical protein